MSFEASELWSADVEVIDRGFGPELRTVNERRIAGDRNTTAIGDPKWINSTFLLFTSDVDGYINPWVYDFDREESRPLALSPIQEDFGEAIWRRECALNSL